jgi:3-oxoacyl-[acyl-carrier-protein] synthase II
MRIAVTGVGAVTALGSGCEALMDGLMSGRSGVGAPMFGGRGPVARISGPAQLTSTLALQAVKEASEGQPMRAQFAVVGASTSGDMALGEAAYRDDLLGVAVKPDDYLWRQLCHRPTQEVCRALKIEGPRFTLSTACTSGAAAIGAACDLIASGRAPGAIAFGADALCQITVHGFGSLGVYSPDPCTPFDKHRRGLNLGEGAGAMMLEPLDAALSRGASPLAIVGGYGNSSDAHHLSTPDPTGAGARRAIRRALNTFPAEQVTYVSAHGTATQLNDAMEAVALASELPAAAISGQKGAIGHTLGAAGALEAIVAALAVHQGRLPPNVGMKQSDFALDLITQGREEPVGAAMSVNFAFAGNNTALLFERWHG